MHWAREEQTVKVSGFSFVLHHKPSTSTVTFPWVIKKTKLQPWLTPLKPENKQHVKHTSNGPYLRRTVFSRRRDFTLGLKKENKMRSRVQLISHNWVFSVTGSLIKTDTVLKNNHLEMKAKGRCMCKNTPYQILSVSLIKAWLTARCSRFLQLRLFCEDHG